MEFSNCGGKCQKIKYVKMAKKIFFQQGISGPNFSSKASVTFSNCGGKCQKMKCLKTAKMLKIALF